MLRFLFRRVPPTIHAWRKRRPGPRRTCRARSTALFFALVAVWTTTAPCAGQVPAEDERQIVAAAFEAYQAYREGFTNFRCRFVLTMGDAPSEERARAGDVRPWEGCGVLAGEWLVRGEYEKYSLICDSPTVPSVEVSVGGKNGKMAGRGGVSEAILRKGENALKYSFDSGMATVPGRATVFLDGDDLSNIGRYTTPFDFAMFGAMEKWGPYAVYQKAEANRPPHYLGRRMANGVDCDLFEAWIPGSTQQERYFFDATEAGILRQVEAPFENGTAGNGVALEFMPCSGERLFPKKWVRYTTSKSPGPIATWMLETTFLDVDTELGPEDFTLELPAGATVVHRGTSIQVQEATTIRADRIGGLGDLRLWATEGPAPGLSMAAWALRIGLVAVVAVVAVWTYRVLKRRDTPGGSASK